MEVETTDTILNLKEKIQIGYNIKIAQQQIIYKGNILDDKETIATCGINNEDVLMLASKSTQANELQVTIISSTGVENLFIIDPTAKVEDLINMVADRISVDKQALRLYFGKTKLKKNKTLVEQGVKDKNSLQAVTKVPGGK